MDTTDITEVTVTIPKNLREVIIHFADPQVCHDFMVSMRWPSGVGCPRCGDNAVGFVKTRRIWNCKGCKKQFSVKVGTLFEDSPLGLDKWLPAIWLISNCKNGMSSCELARDLGVTQKTAWFMLHRIRVAFQQGNFEKMSGTVEADETFIGGLEKNKHESKKLKAGRGTVGKAVVAGILERGDKETGKASRVKVSVVPNTSAEVLQGEIHATVEECSEVMTDAHRGYRGLDRDYMHGVVDHAVKFVEGRVSTNGLENFWSLTKRTLKGTYVSVEPKHLEAYLGEQVFRFNERKDDNKGRFVKALQGVEGKRLTYHQLIGEPQGIDSPDPLRGGPRADWVVVLLARRAVKKSDFAACLTG